MLAFFNKLPRRLQAVVRFIPEGSIAADIGTDHAYLPIYLAGSGRCPRVIAVEKTESPYLRAVRTVKEAGLEHRIDVRLGDGFESLLPGEVDTAVMTGLGSVSQQQILTAHPRVRDSLDLLVLQPQGKTPPLRRWLAANGWYLVDEDLVFEGGHYYNILAARQGQGPEYSEVEWQLGPLLVQKRHPLLADYVCHRMEKIKTAIKELEHSCKPAAAIQRGNLIGQMKQLQGVIECLQNAAKS